MDLIYKREIPSTDSQIRREKAQHTRSCYRWAIPLLVLVLILASPLARAAVHYERLKSFGFPDHIGENPRAPVLEGSDGKLYGTTWTAGTNGLGTVFQVGKDGTGYRVLHIFGTNVGDGELPWTGLMEASDGFLYGTTSSSTGIGHGTVFKLRRDGSDYSVIHYFSTSGFPSTLIEGDDGALYGTLGETAFRLTKDGSVYRELHRFGSDPLDGIDPQAPLFQGSDGMLYGTTTDGGTNGTGTVFKIGKDGAAYSVIYSFGSIDLDGAYPSGALVEGADGAVYGTTQFGGTNDHGIIFKLKKDGSAYQVLHHFEGTLDGGYSPRARLAKGSDGTLYGTTVLTVFKLIEDGSQFMTLRVFHSAGFDDGPGAGVIVATDGALYGTTMGNFDSRGDIDWGTIFKLNTDGTAYNLLFCFGQAGCDGQTPKALIAGKGGFLYGITPYSVNQWGEIQLGTVFSLNHDGTGYRILHRFSNSSADGQNPTGLFEGLDGALYGTTFLGGSNDWGTVFRLNSDGSDYRLLHHFGSIIGDGQGPWAGVIEGIDGTLYGATRYGGTNGNWGIIFKLGTNGTDYSILHHFSGGTGDGADPRAGLLEGSDGRLYGTTFYGGNKLQGTVFSLTKDGSSFSVLQSFPVNPDDGANPYVGLTEGSDGALYGSNTKTIFAMNKDGSGYHVLHPVGDSYVAGPMVEGKDAALYGILGNEIFRLSKDGSNFASLYLPAGSEGELPISFVLGTDNLFYGTTAFGGDLNLGTVFRFWPPQTPDILGVNIVTNAAHLRVVGMGGYEYQVLRSTDLSHWNLLTTFTMPAEGTYTNLDISSPNPAFYRAAWSP